MRFEEKAVRPRGGGGIEQWRDEVTQTAARAIRALPRLLHRVGAVVYDRRSARGPEPREIAHIDHEITVAEEGAPLGHRDFGRSARADLLNGPRHALGGHPLSLFHVHGPSGPTSRD